MSEEFLENPVFASRFISNFTHYNELDKILLENLDFEQKEEISIALLPIVSQVPENNRGIIRVFIVNTSTLPIDLSLYYFITGWFSDLHKLDNLKFVETITLPPAQVWFRDIAFRSTIKQGKNYFQLLLGKINSKSVKKNGRVKKKISPDDFYTAHSEYLQIRAILEGPQIERSNFLGMSSKAYINPKSLNYWTYYSLFGTRMYRKEHPFILSLKLIGLLAGATFIVLPLLLTSIFTQSYILPIAATVTFVSLISFLTRIDNKKIKLIQKLDLVCHKRKCSLEHLKETPTTVLQKYCLNDINYSFDVKNNAIRWKEGANKMFEKTIPEVARILHSPTEIKPTLRVQESRVEEIKDKETLKQRIEEGIQLQHEKGIRFAEQLETVSDDVEPVTTETEGLKSDSYVHPDIDPIELDPKLKPDIDPIETSASLDPDIDPIETETTMLPEIEPLDTEGKQLVSDVEPMRIDAKTIDVGTIPEPRKLPKKPKDKTKDSVKDS